MKESDTTIDEVAKVDYKNIFYPPGGLLIWILIFLELLTFGIALIVMVILSKDEPELFHQMSQKLHTILGSVNTIVLITSGYFMAKSVHFFKEQKHDKSKISLLLTMLLGGVFILIKSVEYYQKINEGITLGSNTFMNFYWLLTGFHLIHVLVGMVILLWIYFGIKRQETSLEVLDFEAGASFWHMCDLIWLLLFPVLYLLF